MGKHTLYISFVLFAICACQPVSQIQTGEDAFRYKRYPQAVELLQEEIPSEKLDGAKAQKSYWIGESLRLMNQDKASIKWYRQAYELEQNQISLEAYANAVLRSQQYSNAEKLYLKLLELYGQDPLWDNAVKSCQAAKQWIVNQNPDQYLIYKSTLNSSRSDYAPVFYNDILVFTSDRADSKGDTYHWTGNQFTDFYRNREDVKLDALLTQINGPFNDAAITFSKGLNHIVYTQCGSPSESVLKEDCKLIEAKWNENSQRWVGFEVLSFCVSGVEYGHPTFFDDDKAIIFSSDDQNGFGGSDLWVSYKGDEGWTEPVLLPSGINTPGDEVFPRMFGDTLYFSSNGLIGMGGLDIYFAKWIPPSGWNKPVNLKPPINSGGDDFALAFDPGFNPDEERIHKFFISSNRDGSDMDDIYEFVERRMEPVQPPETEKSYKIVVEGQVFVQNYNKSNDPNSGKSKLSTLSEANVTVEPRQGRRITLDKDGKFTVELEKEGKFNFKASKSDYLSDSESLTVSISEEEKKNGGKTYIVRLVLKPLVYNKEIVLKNIYYDFDKWNIRDDAKPSLDSLAEILIDNPEIRIELSSHTDCRGMALYNADLSQKRAQSAVDYLRNAGIDPERMVARGYGENRPAIDCECTSCTEEEHQVNRRTAFTIIR